MSRLPQSDRKDRRYEAAKLGRKFAFEQMEDRRVMMAAGLINPISGNGGLKIDPPPVVSQPSSQATINLNPSTGVLSITGLDAYSDDVKVSIDKSTGASLVQVTVVNVGLPIVQKFAMSKVKAIVFQGLGGDDRFENLTAIQSQAFGGDGNDVLLGGSGVDQFFGGNGNDYLDGRLGDDILYGDADNDLVFGDVGNDALHGGDGVDQLFGGAGNDWLYGDDGADQIDGGIGTNKMFGGVGNDAFFNFTLPKVNIQRVGTAGNNDFTPGSDSANAAFDPTFGWFDARLTDGGVRSLARFNYQDAFISRTEMLGMYTQIEVDGKVSAAEHNDLENISNATQGLVMSDDVRDLSNKVATFNVANRHYQGKALGQLTDCDPASKLDSLVRKWFYGQDLPAIYSGAHYQWVSGSLFVNGPSIADVGQGNNRDGAVGDCYFLASLGEVALHNPIDIQNMFIDNGDGTWTVRFFNGSTPDFVTVNRNLPVQDNGTAQYATFGGSYVLPSNELWVALAEKAYAQVNEEGWTGQDKTNTYAGIDEGQPSVALGQITGNTANQFNGFAGFNASIPSGVFSGGMAVTFTTKQDQEVDHVLANHVYAMVGFDASTQRFLLFNPWGFAPNNTSDDYPALISLTWNEIVSSCNGWTSCQV